MIIEWLTSRLAGPIATGAAALLLVVVIHQAVEIHGLPIFGGGLKAEVATLRARIDDPQTGYVHQIAVCHVNEATILQAIEKQNAAMFVAAREAEAIKFKTAAAAAAAERALAAANRRVGQILSQHAREGESSCDAADRVILESLAP